MEITLKINPELEENKIIVETKCITEDLQKIIDSLQQKGELIDHLLAFKAGEKFFLKTSEVLKFYAQDKKTYALTNSGEYEIKLRLFELEKKLNKSEFIRISNSEIISIKEIKKLDISFSGTIKISGHNNTTSFVSRGYMKNFNNFLKGE